jgi:shikimate dehydrogenase
MTDHYAVVGNPIAHSKSPLIHRFFAEQTSEDMEYRAELGDPAQFESQVTGWFETGLCGLNVTLPFKERALTLATQITPRAQLAGAANTLRFHRDESVVEADNTDGVGLMRDLRDRMGIELGGKKILILGSGGATRGILGPILDAQPMQVVLTNRTEERAIALVKSMQTISQVQKLIFKSQVELANQNLSFDLVINATSSSLTGALPEIPENVWSKLPVAYDLAYAPSGETSFLVWAKKCGASQCADGLGMLIEQAAEAFYWWRGVRPQTQVVLQHIRNALVEQ